MIYQSNGKNINFTNPLVMAIVNLTQDSFYDGGKYDSINDILKDIEIKVKEGADIIDIGAFSSRPGAKDITKEEEWNRLEKPIKAITKHFPDILLSVDTYRSEIAKKVVDLGVNIINDISGGNKDDKMFDTVASLDVTYILMHMQGNPEDMQLNPQYENVVTDILREFIDKIKYLNDKGFNKIITDVGFGFGKSLNDNFQLLKELKQFTGLSYPTLVGLSRKSMINKVIGSSPITALNGTTALHTIALLNGANILRVHDVAEAKEVIKLVDFYKNA